MATTETRMLLLGAVAIFEPVNGYQIRRELVSWGVEDWANIKPGSIYNGLTTLAQRGELVRHDLRDGTREVAVYELSDTGRAEFTRLFEEAITQVRPDLPTGLPDGALDAPARLARGAKRLLKQRLANLDAEADGYAEKSVDVEHVPPHVACGDGLLGAGRQGRAGVVAAAALPHRGRGAQLPRRADGLDPAADDPGHQMSADRERYLAMLRH